MTYFNHLYVYPQTLSFDSQKMFIRTRNIACIVELDDDDGENVKLLRVIYERPGSSLLCHVLRLHREKNLSLFKYTPAAKSMLEKLIYSAKGMLVLNDSAATFWMGNLVNKNLDGREIFLQIEETTRHEYKLGRIS